MHGDQLERSILESKERDELQAIAAAMSLKPAARTKKSDIIDLILDATGIAANGGSADEAPTVLSDVDAIADEPIIAPRPRRAPRRTTSQASTADAGVAESLTGVALDADSESPSRNGVSADENG